MLNRGLLTEDTVTKTEIELLIATTGEEVSVRTCAGQLQEAIAAKVENAQFLELLATKQKEEELDADYRSTMHRFVRQLRHSFGTKSRAFISATPLDTRCVTYSTWCPC